MDLRNAAQATQIDISLLGKVHDCVFVGGGREVAP
jgi:hypothetical protein